MHYIMKLISAVGIALFLATSVQAETITPQEASHYAGSAITVEGVVSQVKTTGGGTTFINFGGRYPNHVFYGVIFRSNQDRFSKVHSLEGKTISISGTIEFYKGKPQIVLTSPNQIKLR
ncbi:nucleotide-binding protein [Amylibacter sp. SFDW26]|uniref:nucleotide-binding protein n=1 Tax=Amylibacter sp. SFDW26 TaxID=2652722 RepID=UPI001262A17C|nr:nucleotide-binding protein [Amylibacter sp. SFDW26]KAB7610120.1 nucleotide-binding protein [Amylibacter sp. SFDW26]